MARTSATVAIYRVRSTDMRFRPHATDPGVATLWLATAEAWVYLDRSDPDEAQAQAEAMDRLVEGATQAAVWLRGGDQPEQAAAVTL